MRKKRVAASPRPMRYANASPLDPESSSTLDAAMQSRNSIQRPNPAGTREPRRLAMATSAGVISGQAK